MSKRPSIFNPKVATNSLLLYKYIKNYTTIFFFLGKKINREPLWYERDLLHKQRITLRQIKNLNFLALRTNAIFQDQIPSLLGYNLIGTSEKVWSSEEIQSIFNINFPNIAIISVITQGVVYSTKRITDLPILYQKQQSLALLFKVIANYHFVLLTRTLNAFLSYHIKTFRVNSNIS